MEQAVATERVGMDAPSTELGTALGGLVLRPQTLLAVWSWKAAAISAMLRATTFFASNVRAGRHEAIRAGLVEAGFAIFAAGLMGAVSQRLRAAKPLWATLLVIAFAMPAAETALQRSVHRAAETPHILVGLIVSFCFASVASSFSWFAMRQGVLLGGSATTSVKEDARRLPGVVLAFVLAAPRAAMRAARGEGDSD